MFSKQSIFSGAVILFLGLAFTAFEANAQIQKKSQTQSVLTGKVVNAETGQAVSGVKVKIAGADKSTETDRKGLFTFSNLSPGSYTIQVNNDKYKKFEKQIQVTNEGKNLTIELVPAATPKK